MKRVNLFLILLIAAITALIASTIIGFALFSNQQNPYGWMSQMWNYMNSGNPSGTGGMGGMMGQNPTTIASTSSILPYYGILFAVLIALTIISVIGVSYYLVYPQIRIGPIPTSTVISQPSNGKSAYESVSKTLTNNERKVIEVLQTHEGKYLQKYIKSETGLSRLQTHRIVARLAERGIISLEKTGNTNQVYLADWLSKQ
jgi:uncharacterized membrane protein